MDNFGLDAAFRPRRSNALAVGGATLEFTHHCCDSDMSQAWALSVDVAHKLPKMRLVFKSFDPKQYTNPLQMNDASRRSPRSPAPTTTSARLQSLPTLFLRS
jgi:hypothetical protein